jgi:hypothetical protein
VLAVCRRDPSLGDVAIQSGENGASDWVASTQGRLAMTGLIAQEHRFGS